MSNDWMPGRRAASAAKPKTALAAAVILLALAVTACMMYDDGAEEGIKGGLNIPATPTVTAEPYASNAITLNIVRVDYATFYKIYHSLYSYGPYNLKASVYMLNISEPVFFMRDNKNLAPDTTYYYRVAASNSSGESPMSPYVQAKTYSGSYPAMPSTPTNVNAGGTANSITITWDKVDEADGYKLFRSTSAGSFSSEDLIYNDANNSYADTGLDPNTYYYYLLRAYVNIPGSASTLECNGFSMTIRTNS